MDSDLILSGMTNLEIKKFREEDLKNTKYIIGVDCAIFGQDKSTTTVILKKDFYDKSHKKI